MTAASSGGQVRSSGDEYPRRPRDTRRTGARILDTAEGVLTALRRCRVDRSFVELMQTAKQHGVNPVGLADALVAFAEDQLADDIDGVAAAVARATWGHLFGRVDEPEGAPTEGGTASAERAEPRRIEISHSDQTKVIEC